MCLCVFVCGVIVEQDAMHVPVCACECLCACACVCLCGVCVHCTEARVCVCVWTAEVLQIRGGVVFGARRMVCVQEKVL